MQLIFERNFLPLCQIILKLKIMKVFHYLAVIVAAIAAMISCTPEGYEKEADPASGRDFLYVKSVDVVIHKSSDIFKTTGRVVFTWDSKGRLLKEEISSLGLASTGSFTVNYTYDDANRTCTVKRSDVDNYEVYRFDRKGYLVRTEGYDGEGKPTIGLHRVIKDGKLISESIAGYDSKKGRWTDIMTDTYEWNGDRDIVKVVPPSVNVISPDVPLYNKIYTYSDDGKLNRIPFTLSRDMMLVTGHLECPAALPAHALKSIAEDGGEKITESYSWSYDTSGRPSEVSIFQRGGVENGYYTTIKFNY